MAQATARGGVDDPTPVVGEVLVAVRGGVLRGRREDGLTVLRGVRYAAAARFAPPVAEEPWEGVRDAFEHGPVSPQPPSRPGSMLGPSDDREQSDDCLSVTVVTPAADGARRPVLVWLHGGSYRTGAGSWDRYGGQRLAREGDVVVVNVNSRLGALGYLHLPGVSDGNLGLLDQLEALRWVRDNAAHLGGDPDNVTVVGQSSGAHSIACLLGIPAARALMRRAVLQSPPMGLGLSTPEAARPVGERFLANLGQDPRQAPVDAILAAQQRTEQDLTGRTGMSFTPRYVPVAGVDPLPVGDDWRAACRRLAPGLEVIVGTTGREIAYFLAGGPISRRVPLVGGAVEEAAIRLATRSVFTRPTLEFAALLADAGAAVHAYRIEETSVTGPMRSCHCGDLPRLFGGQDAWAGAPMLAGQDWADIDAGGRPMREAWLSFATTGSGGLAGSWPAYTRRRGAVRRFNP
ncbi:carboxylesterase family protein [Rugosimonospora acidiphila]|uniref:Carboxylesterase family protein n=1 Tax=Rugosimonospora acidiphila TaxID=556531 RepID=A0ABP9SIJ0_9ACTN